MFARFVLTLLFAFAHSENINNAVETEMFAVLISPNLFNWTYQEFEEQYRFQAALRGRPELPPWLRYVYSARHHSGFIFGTPPRGTASPITLEVIGLNRQNYETRRVLITLKIQRKEKMALHEVELKIDNLNVEDLLDEHRLTRLKDILRMKLWTESKQDLYPTFLSSAIDMGARLPLRPSDGEGLVVRLGSSMSFSTELKRLREEVRPLSRLPSCPREYKRTTVERLFRDAGFTLDWCNFELYNTIYKQHSTVHLEYLAHAADAAHAGDGPAAAAPWSAPARRSLPRRSVARQLLAALAPPLLLLLLALAALTAVLCYRYATMTDPESEHFIQNIYHICIDYKRTRAHKSGRVELCRYGTGNTEQTQLADNASTKSLGVSPNNSLVRPYSPKSTTNLAGSYNRPQPPPYLGSAANSLHHRKSGNNANTPSTSGHSPEHNRTHLALEESLKLLNEAKIASNFDGIQKEPIVGLTDGAEDYVLVKPDPYVPIKLDPAGYGAINPDLDDIDVPELGKYGISGLGAM